MAQIDDLVGRVGDERLRRDLEAAVGRFRDGLKFGLVFEEHEPEVLPAPEVPLTVGGLALFNASDAGKRLVRIVTAPGGVLK